MISLCKIDGVSYDVLVTALEETTEIVEGSNSGTALYRNRELRDLKGIKIGHNVTFSPDNDPDTYDALYRYLFGSLRESVMLEVVYNQETITYEAAYNTSSRRVATINDNDDFIGWDDLTVAFRPMELQIVGE